MSETYTWIKKVGKVYHPLHPDQSRYPDSSWCGEGWSAHWYLTETWLAERAGYRQCRNCKRYMEYDRNLPRMTIDIPAIREIVETP